MPSGNKGIFHRLTGESIKDFSEQITPVDIKRVDADSDTYLVCASVVSDVLLPGEGASDSESILQVVIKTCIDHEDTGLITCKGHDILHAMGIKLGPVFVKTFNDIFDREIWPLGK